MYEAMLNEISMAPLSAADSHMIAFALGFLLDLLLGDPQSRFHPVCMIGGLIGSMEKLWNSRKDDSGNRMKGALLAANVLLITAAVTSELLRLAYFVHPFIGVAAETVMVWLLLATRSLRRESEKVYASLAAGDVDGARQGLSMIVGRDTGGLDEQGIVRAAVETIAENTSDGVIAPMLYAALFGPVGGWIYKAINTMDSMIGYKNKRYRTFGTVAARLDDLANLLPSRIAAGLLLLSAAIFGSDYDGRNGIRIFWRDRKKSTSPNAGQTESAVAGILGIRLLGDAVYFGKTVHKETVGDALRPVEREDIHRAQKLLYAGAVLCWIFCLGIMLLTRYSNKV